MSKKQVTFVCPRNSGLSSLLWDKKNDQPLVNFEDRKFTTDDPKLIKKLTELGYPKLGGGGHGKNSNE